jgi:hypothetical protein
LPCIFKGGTRQSQIFAVRFPRDARQFFYTNVWPTAPSWPAVRADGWQALLCALEQRTTKTTSLSRVFVWRTAKLQHCRVFYIGTRQCIFKNWVFTPYFNFSSTSILFCTLHFNYVIISLFLLILTNCFDG